jgi:hypothetical protein
MIAGKQRHLIILCRCRMHLTAVHTSDLMHQRLCPCQLVLLAPKAADQLRKNTVFAWTQQQRVLLVDSLAALSCENNNQKSNHYEYGAQQQYRETGLPQGHKMRAASPVQDYTHRSSYIVVHKEKSPNMYNGSVFRDKSLCAFCLQRAGHQSGMHWQRCLHQFPVDGALCANSQPRPHPA